ncbi:hemolysin family protein [Kribbia dieselivorans]|uniref:hemolysin family protein n=1 Tax=Kribbia dieselivorans TaxID=331526 RepID=UPI0009FB037A|nr:hemolysin family protein [Kribbia dieselivorans]
MTEWLLLALSIVLTAGTALFVAAEFSLVALDRPSVQKAVDDGNTKAKPVLGSLGRLSTLLSVSQVGITLTTLILGYVANPSIGALLTPVLTWVGVPPSAAGPTAAVLAMIIATVFSMILGEMVPKTLAVSAPLATGIAVVRPMRVFEILFRPLIVVLNGSANWFLRRIGIEPAEELSAARSPAELASLVRTSAEAGTLEPSTARLVTRSLGFGEQTAQDVMTPRSRASAIERTATAADVLALARATGHSRFPVIGEDWDDVDGVVHVKKAMGVPFERRGDVKVSGLMVDVEMVPETLRLDPLMKKLRDGAGLQLAIVVDEYGGTSGVVTLEDLVEEIVGDVSDEHDRAQSTGRRLAGGAWTVPGLWRPDEVRERVGARVPEGSAYETVAGFVMARLGRVPAVGDAVTIDGWRLTVTTMDGLRVDRLRFTPIGSTTASTPMTDSADGTAATREVAP